MFDVRLKGSVISAGKAHEIATELVANVSSAVETLPLLAQLEIAKNILIDAGGDPNFEPTKQDPYHPSLALAQGLVHRVQEFLTKNFPELSNTGPDHGAFNNAVLRRAETLNEKCRPTQEVTPSP